MASESSPGFLEKFSYLSRNIEGALAVVALIAGSGGVAALFGIGAVVDHAAGETLKNHRLKKEK